MFVINSGELNVHDKRLLKFKEAKLKNGLYVLSGDNGIGKTTFLNEIYNANIKVALNEEEITTQNRRKYIGYCPQRDILLNELSVPEVIDIIVPENTSVEPIAERLNCSGLLTSKKTYSTLSGGEKQKIKLICTIALDRPILLLDEIDNSLDKESVVEITHIIKELKQEKIILLISHNYEFFKEVIDDIFTFTETEIIVPQRINEQSIAKVATSEPPLKTKSFKALSKYFQQVYILVAISMVVFTLIFTLNAFRLDFYTGTSLAYDQPYKNFSSVILSPVNSPFMDSLGEKNWRDNTPALFNEDFYKALKDTDYITKIETIPNLQKASNYVTYIDENDKQYTLSKGEYSIDLSKVSSEVAKTVEKNEIVLPGSFNVEFEQMVYTQDVYINTPNNSGYDLLWGSYPQDETNQVLIPLPLAVYLMQKDGIDNINDLINKKYDVPLNQVEGVKTIGTANKSFVISGIYTSSMDTNIIYAYNPNTMISKANDCSLSTGAIYESCVYDDLNLYVDDSEFIKLKDKDELGKYIGFYVEVQNEDDLKTLTETVAKYDPYIYVDNTYVRNDQSELSVFMPKIKKILKRNILYLVVFLGLLYILLKYHFNNYKEVDEFVAHYNLKDTTYTKFKKKKVRTINVIVSIFMILGYLYLLYKIIGESITYNQGVNIKFIVIVTILYAISIIVLNTMISIMRRRNE